MSHTMKLLAVVVLLVSASLQSAVAGQSSRTVSVDYDGPNGLVISAVNNYTYIYTIQSDKVPAEEGERSVSAEITDESGNPVAAAVHQGGAELGITCGAGAEKFTLVNRKPIHLHLQFGVSTDCTGVSTPSSGTIELTFSR